MEQYPFVAYRPERLPLFTVEERSRTEYAHMQERRSVRRFSSDPIPDKIIEQLILTAGTAPSGANMQPWTFCVVKDPDLKKRIRIAAEEEEITNYSGRMPEEWLRDLAPLGTDSDKEFLETAPLLIVVFKQNYRIDNEKKLNNYYVTESVGIATGFLISAIHRIGLASLTHTPSPMQFLKKILNRPENETPFLLLPVGYPHPEATVPHIQRKGLLDIAVVY